MKKIILSIVIFLFSFAGFSQIATPFEGFEAATFPPTTPASWAVFDNGVSAGGINNKNWVALGTPLALINEGLKSAYMDGRQQIGAGNTARDFLASPAVTVETNGQLKFFTRTNTPTPVGTNLQIRVKLVSAGPQNDPNGYEIIQEWNNGSVPPLTTPFNVYQEKTVDFNLTPQYQNVPVYIAFCLENFQEAATTTANRWLVDQVRIVTQCNAPAPTSLTATSILSSSATLGWAAVTGSVGYEIESQLQATPFTGTATSSSTTNSFAQTGLMGSTCYHFRVRTNCGNGNFSAWSGDFLYCTTVTPPVCGGIFTDSGGSASNYSNNENNTITIPPTPGNQVTVTFTAFNTQATSDTLKIYDGDSTSGILLGTYSGTTLPPTFTGSTASGALTFVFTSNGSTTASGWIANVTCNPPPACQKPTSFVVSSPTVNSVDISWTNLGLVSSNEVIALPCNSPAPTAASVGVAVTTSPIVFSTGINSATCYDFYIRSVCPGSLLSTWTGPLSATTLVAPPACGGQFFDTGGSAGNYQDNENYTVTIPPAIAGQQVTVAFTAFNTESGFDELSIYDGTAAGTLLGTFSGTTLPPTFTGSTPSGALTFVFTSDVSAVRTGWVADVTCAPPPTCVKPITLASAAITQNGATISWTQPANPNGSIATAWEYVALPSPSVAPTSTTLGTAIGSNPTIISILAAGTCYDFYLRAVCSTTANDVSLWSEPINFCTLSAPPVCGGNYVDEGGIPNDYNPNSDVTTTICPTNIGDVVTVTFTSFNTEANWDGIYVYNGNNTNPANLISSGLTTANLPLSALAGAYWGTTIPGPFTSESPDGCLTFVFKSDDFVQRPGWNSVITCGPPDPCKKPKNLATSLVTATTTTLSWTQLPNPDGSTSNNWRVIKVPCGAPAPTNTSIGWINTTNNPYQFTGLTSETCYDFYVQAVCSPTLNSSIVGPVSATTLIIPPTCGQQFFDLGGQGGTATSGAANNYPNSANSTTIICPQSPGQIVTVTFTVFNTETNFDGLYVFDGPTVNSTQIPDPNNGPGFGQLTEAGSYWGTTIPGPFTSTSPDGCLTFNFRSDGSVNRTGWEANVTCTAAPTCARPYLLNATNTTQTTTSLGWTQLPNIGGGTATAWEVLVLPAGSPVPTTNGIPTTTNPYLVTGLTPGTAYVFYVRAICSNSDQSIWSAFNFATNPLNDECVNATFAVVNQNLTCTQTTPGTLSGATQSTQVTTCLGTTNDDVWFTFTATAPTHIISFNNVVGGTVAGLRYGVFQGNVCGSLTEVGCNSSAGLTPGTTYYVRVYSTAATPQFTTFNLCIGTLPCTEAPAFCTGQTVTYANSTNIPSLGQIGCLVTSPNPAFFFLQVNQSGPLTYLISQEDAGGVGRDVDYVAWGPFTSLETACTGVPASPLPGVIPAPSPADGCPVSGEIHACSYSPDPEEIICIPNAQLCEVYVIMITNFSNQPGTVTFTQSNTGGGTTSCFPINTFNYSKTIYCKDELPNAVPVLGNGASAGTYSATPAGLDLDPVTGIVTLASSNPGTYTVTSETATVVGGTCSSIPSIITRRTIVIEAPSDATISYNLPAKWCNNDDAQKAVSIVGTNGITGGTYSATPAGLSINPSNGAILPVASLPGIYNVVYTKAANPSGGCPTYVSPAFEVEILAIPNIIAPNSQNACLNFTLPVLTGDGKYYTSTNGGGTEILAGTVITTSQTIYVYASNSNCSSEKQFTITIGVNITPVTDFTYPITVCKNGVNPLPVQAPLFTAGGTYSCLNTALIINPTTGLIDLATSPANTYTITYKINANTTTCLLEGSKDFDITILPLNTPLNGFNYTSPVCKNGINPTPIVDSGFIGGGVFSCANSLLIINSATGEINLATSPAGTFTINYNLPASTNILNCYAEVNSPATITINPVITSVSTLTYPLSTACTLGSNMLPTIETIFSSDGVVITTPPTFPIVITYSATPVATPTFLGLDLNSSTGEINLANSAPGNYVITVTITGNAANCYAGSIKTFDLTVNAPTFQDTTFSYVSPVCKSATINPTPVTNSTFVFGGIFSSNTLSSPLQLNELTGEINLNNAPSGTHDILYGLPSNSVLCLSGGSSSAQITINAVKTPIFTQIPSICQGTNAPLFPTSSNDVPSITGVWNALISTTNVGSITYTFTPDPNQCASTTSMTITIDVPSIDPIFATIAPICEMTSTIPALPNVFNNSTPISGNWNPSVITSNLVGDKTYIFTPNPGQCAKSAQLIINTKALPIFGITQDCKGPSYTLDIVPALNGASYGWNSVNDFVANGSSAVVKKLGEYTCDVTVNGCTKTVKFNVTNTTCEIQKGISPNNDSLNDEFDLSTLNVKQLNIYNRYGTDVYSKTSYTKEWFGQSNAGEVLPDGTYYYVAELGDGNTKTGWVYINKETN